MNKRKKKINYERIINKRVFVILIALISLFSVVFIKLFMVMLIDKDKYNDKLLALTNKSITLNSSPRGRIYDRNYNVIVDNKAINTIVYKKEKGTTNKEMIELAYTVSPHLNLDVSRLTLRAKKEFYLAKYPDKCKKKIKSSEYEKVKQRKLSNKDIEELKIERISLDELNVFKDEDLKTAYLYYLMNNGYTYEEKVIKNGVTDEEFAYISENNDKLKGFNTRVDWERVYPYGDTLRTILGTVSSSSQGIPSEDKNYYLKLGYSLNDRVGLSYLEKQYESYLKGEKNVYEAVNSHELRLVKEGMRGNDIVLSIDINLQKEIDNLIDEAIIKAKSEANTEYYDHSSVIVTDPNTGEILAIASRKIVGDKIIDNVNSILISPITPGSVVKGASMLVGYETGAIKFGEKMLDECVKIAGAPEKCSSVNDLGVIDDLTAMAKSSNVYQFKTAIRVNGQEYYRGMKLNFNQKAFDTYRNMYHAFGLGVKTEIDLPIESAGYTSVDKASGNLLDFVMGQYETYTPIQLAQYVSTIANGGNRMQPHLLKEVRKATDKDTLGDVMYTFEPKVLNKIEVKSENLKRVQEGFYAVMHMPGGYGRGYINDRMDAAGKTGTSQSFIDTNNDGIIDTETITSSFIGYAPYNNPKVAFMVTSPNSSHTNSSNNFASLVNYRLTRAITDKYYDMYGI
ncbi:MAG: penicillin-binding protein 2 [Bacilli bacterium]|nr:penicillin-binding protein 2 [bacterium]MDY2696715.1 penicillin-binding protein 2 [Bacilli bacterium]